ncbi:hypothetical protein B0F90DRAFT_1722333 [Multifurca ochricompacta]|uniref:Amine oxidase domain-containing protein n=1 Tax=Multifurca ochricompacta TaxID=376703 RepID=A0AAD4M487_9AGAM|nr:hypothetical protein B0F90DRAFT_1722333 [Multifurca ochricompacta]
MPTSSEVKILIIGAGPTGLGAAKRIDDLHKQGLTSASYLLLEKMEEPGGLASTDTTPEGFLFDVGGHVIFSHYSYFDQALEQALPKDADWFTHPRVSYVRSHNTWVAYPYQNNIFQLPPEAQVKAINGLVDAYAQSIVVQQKPTNFDEWIIRHMGSGIADMFMRPYNYKVWGIPTPLMQCNWLGERVAAPDLKSVISNLIRKKEAGNWGPNATFKFPAHGGTHGVWKAVVKTLPQDKIKLGTAVTRIDPADKIAYCSDGSEIKYEKCISTMGVDRLVDILPTNSNAKATPETVRNAAKGLVYSTTHVIGIGLRGEACPEVANMCWMYFPEDNTPFYRATVFSNYSSNLCPQKGTKLKTLRQADGNNTHYTEAREGPYWSLMLEVCESAHKPVNRSTMVEEAIQGCVNTGLIKASDDIVSTYHRNFDHGYPTPTLNRDSCIAVVLPYLQKNLDIWSRGRFGAWKYEVANQDHSFMQGVEAVDNILYGTPELTVNNPDWVNSHTNNERNFKT